MTRTPEDCFHLSVEIVRDIHRGAIARFGGSDGDRDLTLLESAVGAPQASFGGKSPFADVIEVGAAYLFYICRNHPFLDGNKRTALGACLLFLDLNGVKTKPDGPEWEELTLAVASSLIDRTETTKKLQSLVLM